MSRLGVWVSFLNPTYDTPDYPYRPIDYPWMPDATLPNNIPTSIPTHYSAFPSYDRGHLTPNADRNRNIKDQIATFLTTNLLPQEEKTNQSQAWYKFEQFSRNIVKDRGWELYTIAGGFGALSDEQTDPLKVLYGINTPEWFWKVIVALKPGQGLADITANTPVIAVKFPNFPVSPNPDVPDEPDPRLWSTWTVRIKDIETLTGLDLLSNLPDPIESALEEKYRYTGSSDSDFFPLPTSIFAPLLAGTDSGEANNLSSIGQDGIAENRAFNTVIFDPIEKFDPRLTQIDIGQVGTLKQWSETQNRSIQSSSSEISITQWALSQIGKTEIGSDQDRFNQNSLRYDGVTEVSSTQIGCFQPSTPQISSTQISTAQISPIQSSSKEDSSTQIDTRQLCIIQPSRVNFNPTEISLPSSIALQQLLSSHNYSLQNTTVPSWLEFLQGPSPFNLNIEIADLPTGQLAEATITGFDPTGRPNSGTLYLDTDANGLGWYIDPTPWDNTEYSQTLTDTAYRATPGSDAYGHYDLLTTLLHETAHLQGFIAGYSNYDNRVQTINGSKTFIGDGFSAILTPDGSHLSSQVYPYDLMNTTLTPGVRKLPSALDIQILNAVRSKPRTASETQFAVRSSELAPAAALSAGALIGINNGSFDTPTDWYTRGDSQILNGQAILSEDSPYLSHLSQTFVIPQGAKALQFTLINTDLRSSNSSLAPGDAFEIALLNHTTNTSALAPLTGLSNTDALLNIQSNGQTYSSKAVTLGGASGSGWVSGGALSLPKGAEPTPRTVQIDVSTLTPGTVVTLYFDLLGFGTKDSTVTIDDVQLLAELSQAPIAQNDSATTNQNTAIIVDVLSNDRDPDGTLNPSSLIILQSPQHGQISLNPNGTVTYRPTNGYTGSDQFTYAIQDNSGVYSNPATVNLSILNPIPTINQITIDSTLSEGTPANFSASATISGNQPLTYTWDLGDGSSPAQGQTINHTYANNGTYTTTEKLKSEKVRVTIAVVLSE